ncbi:MAG TPA: biotin--[acetyl-CoA-carboxylase] ligase, partial [Polyangia bacterium]|nr:biotin--[acetyl-CoA-carboxylase] ligase [Polyangia bacterium]
TRWLGRPCLCLAECASTNDVAAERGRAGAAEGLVVIADAQTGGRGRLGRTWHAPPGANLTFSILLRPSLRPHEVPPLTLLAGAAVAAAIAPLGVNPRLKWPNDVQVVQHCRPLHATAFDAQDPPLKIAGVLTEMATEGDRVGHVVVGIGLNVNDTTLPPELAGRATSMALATGHQFDRIEVLDRVLSAFEDAYEQFREQGPAVAVTWWQVYGATGARYRVRIGDRDLEGVVLGIDPDGALRLAGDDGRVHRVVSGELT